MTDTENITLSKILVLDLLRRELSECKAALLRAPFPLPIDEWARGPKLDKDEPQV